jgi:RNA polymerase sigma-70 factor, ECF subfamily
VVGGLSALLPGPRGRRSWVVVSDVGQGELAPEAVWAYREDLGRLARHLCRHTQDAEDVAQSALLKAIQHLDGFRAEASVRTWLHRVATNECRMLRRRKTPISLDTLADDRGGDGLVLADGDDPEQAAVEAERHAAVLESLEALPTHYRTVVLLTEGQGLSAQAVARLTGTTVGAVRSTLHRARSMLREDLRARLAEDR